MDAVIVEIRPAEGGNDAKLFTQDLYKVLIKYCHRRRWKTEIIEVRPDSQGYNEITFVVRGKGVSRLEKEAGGHRVQRVPPTEKRGRRQTSTVTVAVLPVPKGLSVLIPDHELRWETMRSGGPGGQHQNKTDSAVRVTHIPTGVSAIAQSKSQHANRKTVLEVLMSRLEDQKRSSQKETRDAKRASQVGSGQRGDKIRTIRYQDGRVTDHRTNRKVRLKVWESGDLDQLIS